MRRLLCTAVLAFMLSAGAQAATVTFNFQTSPSGTAAAVAGSPLTFSSSGSSLGVTVNSDIVLNGSATMLTDSNGLGILGGSTEINALESILFNAPTVTSSPGGSAVFAGFETITLTEFNAGDTGTINGTAVSANGVYNLNGATTANVIGTGDNATAPGFQVSQIVANFNVIPSASAVPEPSAFAALLLMGGVAVNRRRRKKN